MKYLVNTSTDPYFNMAFDEYCLERYPSDAPFFYLWRNVPSVIIGANQNACAEVNLRYLESRGIKLARRVTGGGAVYHDLQNMNYTFIGKNLSPVPFVEALRSLGVPAELTGRNDIFVGGCKVSGYARRVCRDREIIHGTLMYDVDIDTLTAALDVPGSKMAVKGIASVRSRVANLRDCLPQFPSLDGLQAALQELLAGGDGEMEFGPERIAEVRRLAEAKFSTWEWIYGRSHAADIRYSSRLACGTVEAEISLDRAYIRNISFKGDFIGDMKPEIVEKALRGTRHDTVSVFAALSALPADVVAACFPGADALALSCLVMGNSE